MRRSTVAVAFATCAIGALPSAVQGDSFDPIRIQLTVAGTARIHKPLKIRASVSADPGVLDPRSGAIRLRIKLADSECGGDFAHTAGRVMLNKRLKPQPRPGKAYSGRAVGKGRPTRSGTHPLCVYLTDDYKQFATDTADYSVRVRR